MEGEQGSEFESDPELGGVYMLAAQDVFRRLEQIPDLCLSVSMFEICEFESSYALGRYLSLCLNLSCVCLLLKYHFSVLGIQQFLFSSTFAFYVFIFPLTKMTTTLDPILSNFRLTLSLRPPPPPPLPDGQKVRDLLNGCVELAALEDGKGVLQLVGLQSEEVRPSVRHVS
jgi:hypothetical protein